MRHERTIERKSVKCLQDLPNLLAHGNVPSAVQSPLNLKNTIDGEHDSVKVAVYKSLSDHVERPIASIIDTLLGHGYEHGTIVCAINTLVNEGILASHRYGHGAPPQDTGVRLVEGRMMPGVDGGSHRSRPGGYRHAATISGCRPDGRLNHRDGIEAAIWKATQDHAVRRLNTVVEIVQVAGFPPATVKGEIMLLEQLGWFEIDRSGEEPTLRLRDTIDMPSRAHSGAGVPHVQAFDPAQPAEPGSLLEKVQQAQREMDEATHPANADARVQASDEQEGSSKRTALFATGREWICQILASGQHLRTMEIYAALKAGHFNLSKSRLYELVRMLHDDGLLCRDKADPGGSNGAYRYWLARHGPVTDAPGPAINGQVHPPVQPAGPLVISVHLRGVELTLQECGELLQEFGDLWFPARSRDGAGLIESHFTIKGVDLSRRELLEVASYLADAAACLGCLPRHAQRGDGDRFPEWCPAT